MSEKLGELYLFATIFLIEPKISPANKLLLYSQNRTFTEHAIYIRFDSCQLILAGYSYSRLKKGRDLAFGTLH
jgi:hypothetical protein